MLVRTVPRRNKTQIRRSKLGDGTCTSKAEEFVRTPGGEPVPEPRSSALGPVEERAAAHDTICADIVVDRIDGAARRIEVGMITIMDPLPDVTVHGMQEPKIRLQRSYLHRSQRWESIIAVL